MTAEATRVEGFTGFSDEAIQFLLELQAEQSRTWFKAHQDDYVRTCRRPLELFVGELCERLLRGLKPSRIEQRNCALVDEQLGIRLAHFFSRIAGRGGRLLPDLFGLS